MAHHIDHRRLITRRAFFLGATSALTAAALIGRLYHLQFLRAAEYTTLAEDNRIKLQLVPPARGQILDCNGVPLATNEKNFRLLVELDPKRDLKKMLEELNALIPISPEKIEQTLKQARSSRFQPPILIKEHLTWDEMVQFEFYSPSFPGISVDVGQVRHYPYNEEAAHLIGYVAAVAEEDMTDQPLLKLPDFKIGKSGVEKLLEERLRGQAGVKHMEVNVHNLPVRELAYKKGIPGESLRLTIDARLQDYASKRVAEESAAAIVMDVHTGDVRALVSMPGYDPNRFSMGIPQDYWDSLHNNERNPLINKAIAGVYPPGSTFKVMVGLAALEEGVITPDYQVYCPGHFFLGTHQFNCWKEGGHGSVNIHHAIAESCDTFFYTMAQRLGIEKIADISRRFGLGDVPGIGLIGEKAGLIPSEEWKKARYKDIWRPGDTINAGIGQGYVLATPLQLCVMTARLANGGYAVTPRLLHPEEDDAKPKKISVKPENLEAILDGMNAVTGQQYGTAYGRRIIEPEYAMGGKTGTSQVRRITVRGQNQNQLPWKYRHHGLFIGYAPIDEPKYACCVIVEHGGGGAAAAAPVAHDILLAVQKLDDGKPII